MCSIMFQQVQTLMNNMKRRLRKGVKTYRTEMFACGAARRSGPFTGSEPAGERFARILVRPTRSTISEFRTELTGLTQCGLHAGVGFAEARRTPAAEHPTGRHPWAGRGDDDRHRFTRQCRATRTPYPFGRHHTNAKAASPRRTACAADPASRRPWRSAGLPLEGRHHWGEDDAWNIAALSPPPVRADRPAPASAA